MNGNSKGEKRRRRGSALAEYGVLLGLVAAVAIISISALGGKVSGMFSASDSSLSSVGVSASGGAVIPPDDLPDAFFFSASSGLTPSGVATSSGATLSGFDGPLTATCSGCSAMARNGVWGGTTVSGFVSGDVLSLRASASSSFSSSSAVTISVGSGSSSWSLSTRAQDAALDAFSFVSVSGAEPSSTVSSASIPLSGFDGPLTAVCGSGCSALARNGTWGGTSIPGFVPGDQLALRQTSAAGWGASSSASVSVGTTSASWTATTRSQDVAPDAFSFTDRSEVELSTAIVSAAVAVSGFDGPLTATCSGCSSIWRNGARGGTSVSGIMPGDSLALEAVSSSSWGGQVSSSLTLGSSTSSSWLVTTAVESMFSQSDGTPIGNLFQNGGIAAAFDGCKTTSGCPVAVNGFAGNPKWVGKSWGAPRTATRARFYRRSVDGSSPAAGVTVYLQGSTDGFVSSIVTLGSAVAVGTPGEIIDIPTSSTSPGAFAYHRVSASDSQINCSELEFYGH